MSKKCEPTFIGIGFQRCGTSWLNQALYEHPEIGKPESGLHFFNKKFDLGTDWYEKRLAEFDPGNGMVGEFCTAYSYPDVAKNVADRIHQLYPDAKIIMSLREPISRCISDLQRSLRRGEIEYSEGSLTEILKKNPVLLERSYYYDLVSYYYSLFPRKRIKIVLYDDVVDCPDKVYSSVCEFLGVRDDFRPSILDQKVGASYSMKSISVERAVVDLQKNAGSLLSLFPGFVRKPVAKIGKRLVSTIREKNTEVGSDKYDELRRYLVGKFDSDIKKLGSISNLELGRWSDGQ